MNIKKLPLISHKAAANGLDLCKVPGAQTWGPHQWATTMAIGSADYETFAWRLVRENIGQGLRQRYAVAKELPPSSSTPFSKLDVLKVISCYAQAGNASDAGEMPIITKRGVKGHNGSFDPQTLLLLETAFDEAWLTLKFVGNKTVKPDELARSVLGLAMQGERDPARLHDGALERLLPATNWREAS